MASYYKKFMRQFKKKEVANMFSDETLEKIFLREELQRLDLQTQSDVIHAIAEVLEEVQDEEG